MAKASRRLATGPARRQRIVEAARKLIAKHGFEATSTKAIASEAGVPSGLVFYYFETKDALIDSIFDHQPRVIENALAKCKDQSRPIRTMLSALYDEVLAHRYQTQILVAAAASSHPIAQRALSWRRASVNVLAGFLRSQSDGETAVDCETLAHVIVASIMTTVLMDGSGDVSSFIEGLASIVRAALARPL